jgi:uncharacterized protein YoxC|tara:strand:+ start:731 stop:985 length:255 start_codon:yes stop_codon:yes gene_type:complete
MSKLEEKELKELQENRNELTNVTLNLGQISRALKVMPIQEANLHSKIDELEKKQNELTKDLEAKYGKINIDLSSGEYEIIPEQE